MVRLKLQGFLASQRNVTFLCFYTTHHGCHRCRRYHLYIYKSMKLYPTVIGSKIMGYFFIFFYERGIVFSVTLTIKSKGIISNSTSTQGCFCPFYAIYSITHWNSRGSPLWLTFFFCLLVWKCQCIRLLIT